MTPVSRRGRAAIGLALTVGLIGAGCHRLAIRRVDSGLDPRRLGEVGPSLRGGEGVVTATAGVPLPPLPLRPIDDREALDPSAPTPLLDHALARARATDQAIADELDAPPAPPPPAPSPAPDPP